MSNASSQFQSISKKITKIESSPPRMSHSHQSQLPLDRSRFARDRIHGNHADDLGFGNDDEPEFLLNYD